MITIPEVEQLHGEHIQGNICTLGPSDPEVVDIGSKPVLIMYFLSSCPPSSASPRT